MVPPVKFLIPYRYDPDEVSQATGLECKDKSLAIQSAKDECDINVIVQRFGLTGHLPVGLVAPTFADFLDAPADYHGALEAVMKAEDAFLRMPAAVRARFNNDPGSFVAFCSDSSNLEEMRKLGLVDKPADPAPNPPA